MPWLCEVRKPADAPRDGTLFMALRRGRVEQTPCVWDEQAGAFLSLDFAYFDDIVGWWMPAKGFTEEAWWARQEDEA